MAGSETLDETYQHKEALRYIPNNLFFPLFWWSRQSESTLRTLTMIRGRPDFEFTTLKNDTQRIFSIPAAENLLIENQRT